MQYFISVTLCGAPGAPQLSDVRWTGAARHFILGPAKRPGP